MRAPFEIAGRKIAPGSRALVDLQMPRLSSHTELSMPVHVIHGRRDGPTLFVCAAVHGDELNGVEIIRRVLKTRALSRLRGTLIAVPVVNAYGLIHESRYLPDRRDLNRSFPGSDEGSLAARLANLFLEEIVTRCTHGIDLHTGAMHRTNLPQIRGNLDDPETLRLAKAFGVPVLLNASLRDGSLRAAAGELGIPMLLYEAGEALRFDEVSIRAGTQGVLSVMRTLGMLAPSRRKTARPEPFISRRSLWVRAPESGMLATAVRLGAEVARGETLGYVDDAYSGRREAIISTSSGVVIGRLERPLVHEGDAVYHIARFKGDVSEIAGSVEDFQANHSEEEDVSED
ncbi:MULTISPECIES: succinylglutamate desuccinylase/aspartoacylase family protein [unclassified Guyparkeria]|uniref:succinylglutamate desuccinylase/aspartoacylase family protein n=1 Tax=unclassified Guyparkeria TaxID=2626246 RepID=UPI0007334B31|nr:MULTISPECIES: succinylglutamate desuccinylase/aspartoacylase family protein [unclassified Guyparkeria]KTG16493.1 succinylglutamate desuccinylase [Guyparkeria sp. XI15]OAE85433.1 succinylglutamate desuccinylase [Guyparkeria sp. WRN-7]